MALHVPLHGQPSRAATAQDMEPFYTMTSDQALRRFGLPASHQARKEIRELLAQEIERENRGESGEEMLRTLCLQLFSLGVVNDALLIRDAKQSSFDASCGLDIQVICGAGLEQTKHYLSNSSAPVAAQALECLIMCEKSGDFNGWTPMSCIADHREYFEME